MKHIRLLAAGSALVLASSMAVASAAPPQPGGGASFGRFANTSETSNASIVIQYIDAAGSVSSRSATIPAFGSTGLAPTQGDITPPIPSGWSGAVIASSDQDIVGRTWINYSSNTGGAYADPSTGATADNLVDASYTAIYAPSTDLFFPSAARRDNEATKIYVQNTNAVGGASANVYFTFRDFAGVVQGSLVRSNVLGGSQTSVDLFTDVTLPANFLGSVVVTSTQPVAGIAVSSLGVGMFSYNGRPASAAATTAILPKVTRICPANGAFSTSCTTPAGATKESDPGWQENTGIVCANTANATANITLTFTTRTGAVQLVKTSTIDPLSGKGFNLRYASGLTVADQNQLVGDGNTTTPTFNGAAVVTSNQPVVCVAKHTYTVYPVDVGGTQQERRYAGGYNSMTPAQATTTIYAPYAFRTVGTSPCASGQLRYSGIILYNTSGTAATVRIRAYNESGTNLLDWTSSAGALASQSPQGYNTQYGAGIPQATIQAALGTSFFGQMVLTSSQPVVAVQEDWQACPGYMTDADMSALSR